MTSRLKALAFLLLLIAAVVAGMAWYYLFRAVPVYYRSNEEHFKYGSVGVEAASGMPYWIWVVLPDIFPDKLAGADGYKSFGFVWEKGHDAPIGMPVRTIGFPRIGVNCALCHTGTVRGGESEPQDVLLGAPNTTLDLQRYLRFLFACANDQRFSAANIIPAIDAVHHLSWVERLLYRYILIPRTRSALIEQQEQLAWMDTVPDWGPGRQDPFNPAKVQILGHPYDGTIGNADIAALWNWRPRRDFGLHWDGLNNSLTEIFLNSAIGNGATNRTVDTQSLERMKAWILDLKPARYPFSIAADLAARGKPIFDAYCAACHAFSGDKVGTAIPVERVGTDRNRLDAWTEAAKDGFNALDGYDWRYSHFRKTGGYVAVALDGIWARAPYLHNGSVPTLWDLLADPADRPQRFYRGYDGYDRSKVGFSSDGPAAENSGWLFDTQLTGNSNAGHRFGVDLPDPDKWALIEYLKTL